MTRYVLFCLPRIITVVKSRKMRWIESCDLRKEKEKCVKKFYRKISVSENQLENFA
jgi:hypothetical protein